MRDFDVAGAVAFGLLKTGAFDVILITWTQDHVNSSSASIHWPTQPGTFSPAAAAVLPQTDAQRFSSGIDWCCNPLEMGNPQVSTGLSLDFPEHCVKM
jgi:hypothetical protein